MNIQHRRRQLVYGEQLIIIIWWQGSDETYIVMVGAKRHQRKLISASKTGNIIRLFASIQTHGYIFKTKPNVVVDCCWIVTVYRYRRDKNSLLERKGLKVWIIIICMPCFQIISGGLSMLLLYALSVNIFVINFIFPFFLFFIHIMTNWLITIVFYVLRLIAILL